MGSPKKQSSSVPDHPVAATGPQSASGGDRLGRPARAYHLYQGFGAGLGNVAMGLVFGAAWCRTGETVAARPRARDHRHRRVRGLRAAEPPSGLAEVTWAGTAWLTAQVRKLTAMSDDRPPRRAPDPPTEADSRGFRPNRCLRCRRTLSRQIRHARRPRSFAGSSAGPTDRIRKGSAAATASPAATLSASPSAAGSTRTAAAARHRPVPRPQVAGGAGGAFRAGQHAHEGPAGSTDTHRPSPPPSSSPSSRHRWLRMARLARLQGFSVQRVRGAARRRCGHNVVAGRLG